VAKMQVKQKNLMLKL